MAFTFKPVASSGWGVNDVKTVLAILASTDAAKQALSEVLAKQEEVALLLQELVAARKDLEGQQAAIVAQAAAGAVKLEELDQTLKDAKGYREAAIAFQKQLDAKDAALAARTADAESSLAGRVAALEVENKKKYAFWAEYEAGLKQKSDVLASQEEALLKREEDVALREAKATALAKLLKEV